MNMSDFAEDYLVDPKEAMRKLTAGYLNEVLQVEAEKQIKARPYERTGKRRAHRNGTRPRSLKTISLPCSPNFLFKRNALQLAVRVCRRFIQGSPWAQCGTL
jgi:hypothetical protein